MEFFTDQLPPTPEKNPGYAAVIHCEDRVLAGVELGSYFAGTLTSPYGDYVFRVQPSPGTRFYKRCSRFKNFITFFFFEHLSDWTLECCCCCNSSVRPPSAAAAADPATRVRFLRRQCMPVAGNRKCRAARFRRQRVCSWAVGIPNTSHRPNVLERDKNHSIPQIHVAHEARNSGRRRVRELRCVSSSRAWLDARTFVPVVSRATRKTTDSRATPELHRSSVIVVSSCSKT